uniref:MAM domain containing 4 n=1 Tax=Otus sunia TaxID=257818 RepID=A0A8C8AIK9_9STRI
MCALCHPPWAPCPDPRGVFSPVVSSVARTVLPSGSVVVNSCSSTAEQLCNFICDCSNCSDENQCGYLQGSAVLGTPFTCDFEEGDCGWQDGSTSAYRWVRGRANLAAWGTGPHSDHTVGTDLGWFMVTVSPPTKTTATAWLRSPVMQEAAATCEIRAWYHLSGSGEGALPGETGQRWHLAPSPRAAAGAAGWCPRSRGCADAQLTPSPSSRWQLIFSLTQLPTSEAELVLDDIIFRNCGLQEPGQQLCGAEESRCGRGSCLAQRRFCDGTDDCGDGSDEDPTSCSEHPWPWGGGPAHWPPNHVDGLRVYPKSGRGSHVTQAALTDPLGPLHLVAAGRAGQGWGWGKWRAQGQGTAARRGDAEGAPRPSQSHHSLSRVVSPSEKPLTTLPSQAGTGPCAAEEVACDSGGCIGAELACDFAETCADGSDEERCGERRGRPPGSPGARWRGGPRHPLPGTAGAQRCLCRAFLALQAGEGQMVAAAKARTPLLGPSGPACAMEMSYSIHSGPQGNASAQSQDALPGPGVSCLLPAQRSSPRGTLGSPQPPRLPQVELLGLVDLQDSASAAVDNVTFVQCHLNVVPPGATELSCNFERGMCGWYQDQSSDFKWVRGTGQGQGSDHTTGSGYFLAADPSAPWSRGQRAQLITYSQEPTTTPRCLSFWYRLAGPRIGTLNLKMQLEGVEETVLWTRRGTQGSVWHRAWATLPATGRRRYRVAFEALRDGFLGDVALDDLALTAGPCGAELSCSFEAGGCGLAASGQQSWLRQSNGTGTAAGPAADHSVGTAAGHYMVVSTGRGSLPAGHVAALTSQPYQPSAPTQCLAFWYQLSAGTPGSLGVFVEQSGVRRKVMGVSTTEGDVWHRGHVTVQPDGDWQAIFEAVGAGGSHGYIALDDLHVSDGACPEPGETSCDFEQDMCGWSSPSDPHLHSFAWGWKSGVPLAKYPGPEQDHTLGTKNGRYVHFDTSVLGPGGTTARLESQHLPAAADACLQFWYHMDIPEHLCKHSCGELRVMLQGAAGQRTLWSVAGHRRWVPFRGVQGALPVFHSPSSHLPLQIIFELTTRRWPMEGTVALDDIVYSAGGGCHSSLEVPVEGAGPILAGKGQPGTARGAGAKAGAGAISPGRWVEPGSISSPCREILQQLCGRGGAQSSPGHRHPGAGGCWRPVLAEAAGAGKRDTSGEQHAPGLRQHHLSRCKDRGEGLSHLPPTAPKHIFPKSSANPSRLPLSLHSANTSGRCKGLCLLSGRWQTSDPEL